MRTFAHVVISLLAGVLILALAALASGGLLMLAYHGASIYFAFTFNRDSAEFFWKAFPFVTIFGLLLGASLAVTGSYVVFRRIHYDRWLPRRPN